VHALEVEREERGLLAAFARAELHDDALFVERVAGHELRAQPRAEPRDRLRRLDELLAREVAQVGVTAVGEIFGLALLALGLAERSHRLDDRPQVRELLAHAADARGIGGRGGIGHQAAELVVPLLDLREPSAQAGRERAVATHAASASASRSPASASSSDATATSIIRSSGRRVVRRWSTSPGATRSRIAGIR